MKQNLILIVNNNVSPIKKQMVNFTFKLKNHKYESPKPNPTGRELLLIMELTPIEEYELFIKIGEREFEPIQPDEVVDLTQPGIEMFRVRRRHGTTYELDDETYTTYECLVTPAQILQENGLDPDKFYLKEIDGAQENNYKNDPDHLISLRPGMKFISCKKGQTVVA